jgi:putative ABC transport system permease protein
MSGFRTGFSLCGVAALIVGMFLVYNALSVTVAERRHEIGILLSLGATRAQILGLFAGEAAMLGLAGALIGIPLGIGLATLGLQPVHAILNDVFSGLDVRAVDITPHLVLPRCRHRHHGSAASSRRSRHRRKIADAVRRVAKGPRADTSSFCLPRHSAAHMRHHADRSTGCSAANEDSGGLSLVLVAAGRIAVMRDTGGVGHARSPAVSSDRLASAADNLLQSPGRTGMVISALAAGVSPVMQTTGTIRSNRAALRDGCRPRSQPTCS